MKKRPCVIFIIITLVLYLAVLGLPDFHRGAATLPQVVDEQVVTVTQGELITGGQRTPITLPDYFDVTEVTRLQFTLDYTFSGRTVPSLILQANHTFMTILLDGQELYRVEPHPYSLGNYFTYIPLPQQAHGAQLEIQVAVPASGLARVSMSELVITNEAVFLKQQVLEDTPSLFLNTLILLSGLMLLMLALIGRRSIDPYRMLLRGFLALNCAIYFMCETYSVVFLAADARMVYLIDMLSFAVLGPTLLGLLGWELKDWRGKLLNLIAWVGMGVVVAQVAISLLTGAELRRLLPMTHAVQVVGILAVVLCGVYGLIHKKSNSDLYMGGLVALGGAIDLVLFLCEAEENNVFFMKIGFLIYLLYQMYQFVHLLMQRSAEEARESYYKTLAMQDPLSRCYSRAAFDLDKNAWDGESLLTVFFLDLNNLKTTNDLYGHNMGDQLIRAIGGILNRAFFSVGRCYRVGGDEFWILCDSLALGRAAEMVAAVKQATDSYNRSSDLPVRLSYAMGVSDTHEAGGDLNQAIALADARMYENKRAVKGME